MSPSLRMVVMMSIMIWFLEVGVMVWPYVDWCNIWVVVEFNDHVV